MGNKEYRVLDLFAGAGGFSLGFKRFVDENGRKPFKVVGAVEIDKFAAETLVCALIKEHGISREEAESRVICGDITDNGTKELLYKKCRKPIDVLIGGPPCQSFSTIGPRSGDKLKQEKFAVDNRDNLFEHYIEILKTYEPEFFVFENVKGILSKRNSSGEKYIDIILNRLEDVGYHLTSDLEKPQQRYLVLNAADFGVPQLRHRVFIIGRKHKKTPIPRIKPTHCQGGNDELLPWVTLEDAIGDLPPLEPKITYYSGEKGKQVSDEKKKQIDEDNKNRDNGKDEIPYPWDSFNEFYNQGSVARKKFLDAVRPQKRDTILTGHVARSHQASDIKLYEGLLPGMSSKALVAPDAPSHLKELLKLIKYKMDSFEDKYKRLSWDMPCGTIFAHMKKDGNRFIHPGQARTLTVREAARVQSFPDDYVFMAVGNQRYNYIGNAVPPLLAKAIAGAIYESLSCIKSKRGN